MRAFLLSTALLAPLPALADGIQIVTDIAPIHSLTMQVAGDHTQVDVLVSGVASPHDFQFSFAQAGAVQNADLIIWAGPGLTPWLDEALATLAPDAQTLQLLETEGWPRLALRDDPMFAHDDHDEGDDHDDTHAHDHNDDHASTRTDPHAWLNPDVAAVWVGAIASALAAQDPANAASYQANAAAAQARLAALTAEIEAQMDATADAPLLVPHDAYRYFGTRFSRRAIGAISLSDAVAPTPDVVADLQDLVRDTPVACVLSDPQSRPEWVDLVRNDTPARTALADPMGTSFAPGPDHYAQTLRAMATAYADCLGPG